MSNLMLAVAMVALAPTSPLLRESPTNPPIPNFNNEPFGFPTSSKIENRTTIAAHDRSGNWHWSDGTIEPCYNWDTGYYC